MSYSEILQESWTIFWRHKLLWLLGIFGALLGQNSVSVNVNYQVSQPIDTLAPAQLSKPLVNTLLGADWRAFIPLLFAGALLAVIWSVLALILGAWVQGAQIAMVDDALHSGVTGLRASFARSRPRLWSLVGILLVAWLPLLLIFLLLAVTVGPLFARLFFVPLQELGELSEAAFMAMLGPLFCLVPLLLCLGVPAIIVVSLLSVLALRACVLEDMGVRASYGRAWQMVRRHLGQVVLTLLVLFVLSAVLGGMLAVPALFLWIPFAGPFVEGTRTLTTFAGLIVVGAALWAVSVLVGGVVGAFANTLWTRLYLSFAARLAAPVDFDSLLPPTGPVVG